MARIPETFGPLYTSPFVLRVEEWRGKPGDHSQKPEKNLEPSRRWETSQSLLHAFPSHPNPKPQPGNFPMARFGFVYFFLHFLIRAVKPQIKVTRGLQGVWPFSKPFTRKLMQAVVLVWQADLLLAFPSEFCVKQSERGLSRPLYGHGMEGARYTEDA